MLRFTARTARYLRHRLLLLLGLMLLALPISAQIDSSQVIFPVGFEHSNFVTGLDRPTAMVFAPDGRLFITEQDGTLRVVKDGAILEEPFVTIPVNSTGERGLIGVTLDPNFIENSYVYVFYTTESEPVHNRISRFTADGDVALAESEMILVDFEPLTSATNHNGGALHFGLDGMLYASQGDNATASNSQQFSNALGKILRFNPDGSIPEDNPFYDTATDLGQAIWALGLRNPFTFAVHPELGTLYINDVGQGTWEEINEGEAGANYGWPDTEGETDNPEYTSPIYTYPTHVEGCAISGGTFFLPEVTAYPEDYLGDYFFADYCDRWIRRYDAGDDMAYDFVRNATGSIVDLDVFNGELYYLARAGGGQVNVLRTIEQGEGTDILVNGGFELADERNARWPADWKVKNLTKDRIKCNKTGREGKPDKIVAFEGECAFRFKVKDGARSKLVQNVDIADLEVESFRLSAMLDGKNIDPTRGRIQLKVKYEDGTKEKARLAIPGGTYDYTGITGMLAVDDVAMRKVKVILFYRGPGRLFMDAVSLEKFPADEVPAEDLLDLPERPEQGLRGQ